MYRPVLARWIVLLVSVGAAASLFVWRRADHRRDLVKMAPAVDGVKPVSSGPTAAMFGTSTEQTYRVLYSTRVSVLTGQLLTSLEMSGTLKLSGLLASPTRLVRGAFEGTLSQVGTADAGEALGAQDVRRPFYLEFASDGRLLGARGEFGTPPYVARFWTALGEYLQALGAPRSSTAGWESQEADAAGQYTAAYEPRSDGTLAKRKLRYDSLSVKTIQKYAVTSSESVFRFDSSRLLDSLQLSEEIHAEMAPGSPIPGFGSVTKLSLVRVAGPRLVAVDDLLAQSDASVSFGSQAAQEQERAQDQARIGGMTVADTLDRLKQLGDRLDAGREDKDRAGRAFVALTALLRRDPRALAAVRANLQQGDGALDVMLLGALRDASTPETQALLAEMSGARSPLGDEDRLEAARCLSRVTTPTADTVNALKGLRADPLVGTQATYGLGSALHKLNGQDVALAEDIRNALTQQLASAGTPGDQAVVLTALGNAGDPSTLESIRPLVSSAAAEVRAAAAQALRRIPGTDADQLLVRLCADPVADVRSSAVDAIGERPASQVLVAALSPLALGEPVAQIRARVVSLLADWLPGQPAIAATLATVAAQDSIADIRSVAKAALDRRG